MDDLSKLRDEVRKRRAAVTAKENRIRKNTGVKIQGTKEDPRRPPSVIKKYNRTQLNSYLRELNNFMGRDNGYVADSSGGLIPKRKWNNYKRLERQYNKIVQGHFEEIADIKDPYRNVTIRKAESLYVPESSRAQGEIRHRPYNELNRNNKNIKSEQALDKLTKQLEGRLDKGYLPEALDAGRNQAIQMLNNAGLSNLKSTLLKLSNKQFDVLWNYWGFATRLAQIGDSGPHGNGHEKDKDRLDSQESDNIKNDIKEFIEAATDIPEIKDTGKSNRKKK